VRYENVAHYFWELEELSPKGSKRLD